MLYDALANVLHYDRELVAADVRMSINEDGRIGTEAHKLMEDFTYVSPL